MTTFADILAFVKAQARITSSDRDTQLGYAINEGYREVCGTDFWPFLRTTTTQVLTAGTQEYALPSGFGQMANEGVRRYVTNTTQYTQLREVQVPDAELWNGLDTQYAPAAFMIVAGTSNLLRKIRLMPNFTATDLTISYTYYAQVSDVSGSNVLGSPEICDAVAWWVLSQDVDWTRDNGGGMRQADYMNRHQRALKRARQALLT